jgi:hypothetical protein
MTMYLGLSAFTSSPVSLLATIKFLRFPFSMYTYFQYINIISINQKLMCNI